MANDCIFCRIISGGLPSISVFEDNLCVAILDHRPLFPGHCLLLPRHHYETLSDLPKSMVAPLFQSAQLLAEAVEHGMEAEGSFVAINNRVSQSVPHLHVHIVPRKRKDGLRGFFWPRNRYRTDEEMAAVQHILRQTVEKLRREK